MMRFMLEGGFTMWPILLLAIVIALLILVNVIRLFAIGRANARAQSSVNGILFWGTVAVVVGLFGQWSGLYKGFTAAAELGVANPSAVIMGFSETLISTIAGLTVFIVAAPCWFVLHTRCQALRAADPRDHAGGP